MTRGDKLLIVAIIIISIMSLLFINRTVTGYKDKYVSIQVDGEEIKKIIFDKSVIGKTLPIETEYGYNLIEIGDEEVRVIEADCPDQLDIKQGYISKVGEIIVCLPNRLVVEVKGESNETNIDGLSY